MTKPGLMRVLAFGQVLLLRLVFACFFLLAQNGAQAAPGTAGSQPVAPAAEEMRGIWMWSSAVEEEGADAVASRLARYHINKVFLLVKGISGQVCYPSKVALASRPNRDLLKEMLDACHKRHIELHAWYVINCDNLWVKSHPNDAMWSAGEPATWTEGPHSAITNQISIPICPLSQDYRAYLKELIRDVVDRYPVDGIHLDVIRYQHARYCFCPRHQAFAAEHGIDLEKVRKAIHQTFYATNKNRDYYFSLYRQGEPNVSAWVDMRQREIDSIVSDIRAVVKGKNPSLVLSAAFMPEGAERDSTFGICHYGQSYASAGAELDYILPMSYHRSFGKTPAWVAEISINAENLSHRPVYSGIQAFGRDTTKLRGEAGKVSEPQGISAREIRATILAVEKHGIKGFVLFRYGSLTDQMWDELPWNSAPLSRTAKADLDLHAVSSTQQPRNKTTD
jgi:uncharacterized lipoprotein YddW (UPF0748 family)